MELIDYMLYRWKMLTAMALLGVVVIVAVGFGVKDSTYRAKAQLLVRPPVSQSSSFGPNLDRYINTEMALLYTSDSLRTDVSGTDVTATQLARSLSYSHDVGSDLVNLEVTRSDPAEAVLLVNTVAENYVAESNKASSAPAEREAVSLKKRMAKARAGLIKANAEIERAVSEFAASNPDRGVPPAATLSPGASSRQSLLTSELQRLGQQQFDLNLGPLSDAATRTRLLREATRATSQAAWAPTNFITAALGLVLVLLTLSGVGLALSRRVLGEGRWADVTRDSRMMRSIRVRRRTDRQRRRTVRRAIASLRAVGDPEVAVVVAYLPEETDAINRQCAFLLDGLGDAGLNVKETTSLAEVLARQHDGLGESAGVDTPVLLLVDLQQCHLDEAASLGAYPDAVKRRIVPVLV